MGFFIFLFFHLERAEWGEKDGTHGACGGSKEEEKTELKGKRLLFSNFRLFCFFSDSEQWMLHKLSLVLTKPGQGMMGTVSEAGGSQKEQDGGGVRGCGGVLQSR